ncbi:hypothetical protein CLU79DRAFT_8470 [Phycomyces nitens]|nr:hypothetical protein CLU79DRAFT_8470 [Phycomyces nitens]
MNQRPSKPLTSVPTLTLPAHNSLKGKGKDPIPEKTTIESSQSNRLSGSSVYSIASSIEEEVGTTPSRVSSNQPSMALPSLRAAKLEVVGETTDHEASEEEEDFTYIPQKATMIERTTGRHGIANALSMSSKSSMRTRTSSLPKQLFLPRSNTPTPGPEQLSGSFQSLSSSAPISEMSIPQEDQETVPMRRALTQPPFSNAKDPAEIGVASLSRPSTIQQTSGLGSIRKKSNRLSRSSMDGMARKDKRLSNFGLLMKDIMAPRSSYNDASSESSNKTATNGTFNSEDGPQQGRIGNPFGRPPEEPAGSDSLLEKSKHLRLMFLLEQTMVDGGYLTSRLYIPKNLWNQQSIKLASVDVKAAACESMISYLVRLEKWKKFDDVSGSLKVLDTLLESIEGLQTSLSKKLKRDSVNSSSSNGTSNNSVSSGGHPNNGPGKESMGSAGMSTFVSANETSSKKTQSFLSWGTKLSKSVERMNAFSLTKYEDQYRNYIENLQKLFDKVHMLELAVTFLQSSDNYQ